MWSNSRAASCSSRDVTPLEPLKVCRGFFAESAEGPRRTVFVGISTGALGSRGRKPAAQRQPGLRILGDPVFPAEISSQEMFLPTLALWRLGERNMHYAGAT